MEQETGPVAVVSSEVDEAFMKSPGYIVKTAARVDVALILLATMALAARYASSSFVFFKDGWSSHSSPCVCFCSEHDFFQELSGGRKSYGRVNSARVGAKRHETLPQSSPGRVTFKDNATQGSDKPPQRPPPALQTQGKKSPLPPLWKQAPGSEGVQA